MCWWSRYAHNKSAHFCTAHCFSQPSNSCALRYFSVGQTTSQNCTFTWEHLHRHPIPGPTWLSIPNCISISSAIFCTAHGRESLCFRIVRHFSASKLCLCMGDLEPIEYTVFLWPTWIQVRNDILISLAVFAWLTIVTDWPTDTAHYSVCSSGLQDPINLFMALFLGPPGWAGARRELWTLWCKGRLTQADTQTIWLGATPCGPTIDHLHYFPIFTGRMPFLPPNQQCQSTEGH